MKDADRPDAAANRAPPSGAAEVRGPPPSPTPPSGAAEIRGLVKDGVRDLARSAIGAAGDLASDVATGYRKSTRYFKLRAAIVGTWALLAAITFWGACPSSGPSNALGAKARLLAGSIMGSQVFVENESSQIWRDVVVTLEGGWRFEKRTVRPSESFVVPTSRFAKDGAPAPAGVTSRTITIECAEGRVTIPLPIER